MGGHLAIVLPGRAYPASGPALLVPLRALQQVGADSFTVRYPADEGGEELEGAVARQVSAAVDEAQPDRVTFVAKSLGTVALAGLDASVLPSRVDAVWVTPIFRLERVRKGAVATGWRSLLVAGSADSEHLPDHHEAVRSALDAASVVLPGADHGLEVPGDLLATIEGWRRLGDAALTFASGE